MRFGIAQRHFFLPPPKPIEFIILGHAIVLLALLRYRVGLQPEPVWGLGIGNSFIETFFLVLVCLLAVHTLYVRIRKGREAMIHELRILFRPAVGLDILRMFLWFYLIVFGHAWLKLFIPLINPRTYDALLYKIDNLVHFGLNPNRFLIALFPYPWFLQFLDQEYSMFHATMLLALSWFFLVSTRSDRYRLTASFCLLWLVGSWLYVLVPSLGPCYTLAGDYKEVLKHMPKIGLFQRLLIQQYFALRQSARSFQAVPAYGVAAFPSLHVAVQCFLALWAKPRNRFLFVLFTVLTFLTFIASLISGWHYAIDGYAAIAMAYVCVRLFDKRRRTHHPPRRTTKNTKAFSKL